MSAKRWQWGLFISLLLCCGSIYLRAFRERSQTLSELAFRVQELKKEKFLAIQEKNELDLRLHSESDPAWIEMVLMKELGVVPEGWIKIRFTSNT